MPLSANASGWLYALLTSILFALVGLLVPNLLRQSRKKRAHNFLKFWNEYFARHQLSYITFYLAILFTASFFPSFDKRSLAIPVGLTFAFYVVGVYLSSIYQDDVLKKDHQCPDDETCDKAAPKFKVLWPNTSMAITLG